jgi:hypothetical protein
MYLVQQKEEAGKYFSCSFVRCCWFLHSKLSHHHHQGKLFSLWRWVQVEMMVMLRRLVRGSMVDHLQALALLRLVV